MISREYDRCRCRLLSPDKAAPARHQSCRVARVRRNRRQQEQITLPGTNTAMDGCKVAWKRATWSGSSSC